MASDCGGLFDVLANTVHFTPGLLNILRGVEGQKLLERFEAWMKDVRAQCEMEGGEEDTRAGLREAGRSGGGLEEEASPSPHEEGSLSDLLLGVLGSEPGGSGSLYAAPRSLTLPMTWADLRSAIDSELFNTLKKAELEAICRWVMAVSPRPSTEFLLASHSLLLLCTRRQLLPHQMFPASFTRTAFQLALKEALNAHEDRPSGIATGSEGTRKHYEVQSMQGG